MAYQAELRTAILVLHVMQCHRAAMCLDGSLTVGIHSNGSSCEYPMQQLLCTIGLMYCYIIVMQIPKQYGECRYEAERNQYDEVHTANALCLQVNVTSFRVLRHFNTTMHDNLFNFRRLIIGCSNCSFHQIQTKHILANTIAADCNSKLVLKIGQEVSYAIDTGSC